MTGQLKMRTCERDTKVGIPVLLYHRIVEKPVKAEIDTSIKNFRDTLQFLQENGYTTLTSPQYVDIMNGTIPSPEKPILLTFDDATPDFIENALPILKEFHMNAVLFVVPDWIGGSYSFSKDDLIQLSKEEIISIENHSYNHDGDVWGWYGSNKSPITLEQAEEQIVKANEYIEKITGRLPLLMAYPYGSYNEIAKQANKMNGIQYAFKVGYPDEDRFAMGRHYLTDQRVEEIASMITGM